VFTEIFKYGSHEPFTQFHNASTYGSGVTIIFGSPANIRYGLAVLIHNSGHFGPPLPFWAPELLIHQSLSLTLK